MKKIISLILSILIIATSLCTVVATEVKTTVYVYVNDIQTGDEDFWAWIWDENTEGHWVGLDVSGDGYYTVNLSVGQNVVFARIRRAEQPDWSLVWNQSEDTKFTGENNCVVLKYSDTIGGKMSVEWKTIDAVDKNALTFAMREAEKYLYEEPDKYTTDSLNVLWNAYFNAQDTYEFATTQNKIDKATDELNTAISQLVLKDAITTVDKTMLRVAIDTATSYSMSLDKFTDDSWNTLEEKLADANAVYRNENVTQAEVNLATQELLDAIDGLVIDEPEIVDKTMLRVAIDTATSYSMSLDKFTNESWNTMEEKLENAYEVYENENATQAEVNLATQELQDAIDGLERVKELIGDVDGDGVVGITDATFIQRHLAQLNTIDEARHNYADTDKDGRISIVDATMIQKFIAQIIPEL